MSISPLSNPHEQPDQRQRAGKDVTCGWLVARQRLPFRPRPIAVDDVAADRGKHRMPTQNFGKVDHPPPAGHWALDRASKYSAFGSPSGGKANRHPP